jgi:hypothetical protein
VVWSTALVRGRRGVGTFLSSFRWNPERPLPDGARFLAYPSETFGWVRPAHGHRRSLAFLKLSQTVGRDAHTARAYIPLVWLYPFLGGSRLSKPYFRMFLVWYAFVAVAKRSPKRCLLAHLGRGT